MVKIVLITVIAIASTCLAALIKTASWSDRRLEEIKRNSPMFGQIQTNSELHEE